MAFVQAVIGTMNASTGNSASATGSAVGTGNSVVGAFIFIDATAIGTLSVSDNKGNTYTVSSTRTFGGASSVRYSLFHLDNIVGGPTIITASTTEVTANVTFMQVAWTEYSAVLFDAWTSPPNSQSTPGTGANAITTGNFTASQSNDTCVGFFVNASGPVAGYSVGTGFTQRAIDGSAAEWGFLIEDGAIASTTLAATMTDGTNGGTFLYGAGGFGLKASDVLRSQICL